MTGAWIAGRSARNLFVAIAMMALANFVLSSPASAVVAIFDGFGDADIDNNNIPLELNDVDVSGAGFGAVEPYTPVGGGGTPPIFPVGTQVQEVTAVQNAADRGIRWFSISPFTPSPNFHPTVSVHILDDTAGNLPETNPEIGYNHSAAGGTRFAEAINSGLALAAEAKGRANQFAGFFDDNIALGPEVDDEVRVSFDFRIWYSASNLNTNSSINHVPAIGELRFGLYQDTDNQLGQTNPIAGRPDEGGNPTPAVWGQSHGVFRGDQGTVGANGDHGWFVTLPIDDPEVTTLFDHLPGGQNARINEETNTQSSSSDKRIMNGASDFVARPDQNNPQFVNMDINKVYNISLSLKRFDDPATEGNSGDTIYATVTVTERASQQSWSFGNYERVVNPTTLVPDGISSDSWDYFVMGLGGASVSDDFDWLMDNFTVELFGSNASVAGDFNGDGKVDAADYVVWRKRNGTETEYNDWRANFGFGASASGGSFAASAVPEPSTLACLMVATCGLAAPLRRQRK